MEAKVETRIGELDTIIIFKDSSTALYGGESILERRIEIEDANGHVEIVEFPIVSGSGDEVQFHLFVPKVLKIKIILIPSVVVEGSTYTYTEYAAPVLSRYSKILDSKEDNMLYSINPKNVLSAPQGFLREIEWWRELIEATEIHARKGDLVTAQLCLEGLHELAQGN